MAQIANWSGKTANRTLSPKELIKLEMDKSESVDPIATIEEAWELVRGILYGKAGS